jgi:hypothetical protein
MRDIEKLDPVAELEARTEPLSESESTEAIQVLSITGPERDIILAALRHWQRSSNIDSDTYDLAENGRGRFLSDQDIDDLIEEKINV